MALQTLAEGDCQKSLNISLPGTDLGVVQQNFFSSKEIIDVFQRKSRGFRVEEVDQRDEACVEDRKVDVGPVTDALNRDWRNLHDQERELGGSEGIRR